MNHLLPWSYLDLLIDLLIDKFNDTSRYLDDIFTIDNPTFAEHIPDIYPRELQLNKANTSDKETSFLDLKTKRRRSDPVL